MLDAALFEALVVIGGLVVMIVIAVAVFLGMAITVLQSGCVAAGEDSTA